MSSCAFDYFDHLDEIANRLVMRDSVTLCTAEPMAHEPLEVLGTYEDDQKEHLSFGTGFVFPGPTEKCPNGGIELRREGAESLQRLELTYCAD